MNVLTAMEILKTNMLVYGSPPTLVPVQQLNV